VWADSVLDTIGSNWVIASIGATRFITPFLFRFHKLLWATVWGHPRALNGRYRDREYLISYYNRLMEEVKARVPEKQLLVFNVKQGWEPLCKCAANVKLDAFAATIALGELFPIGGFWNRIRHRVLFMV
jgi:hypothetical protein